MRKSLKYILLSAALILCVVLGVKGYILQVASGTWAAQASLTQARSGASAVLMQDGRILVTGGDGAAGTLASAEMIGLDGTSSAAASMSTTRSKHVSAVLANGSVLVAGGTTSGGGAINTAEIYDPVANSWTTVAGAMIEARSNATATVLQDGRVLIAGGDRSGVASSTIEIFDPVALTFSFAGALASPRTDHAMALLSDGRVFIAGGSNGSAALNTTDIYDPVAGTVGVGPALSALRMGHSATTMLDGRVLIAGGNNGTADLASTEIFDPVAGTITAVASSPSTARQGHLAFLLPNNNTVLIVGGTSAGVPLASAEVFTPWLGTFAPTGSLTVARNNSAGSPMKQDGFLVVAGGQDASGVALANTDIYGFATVKTDAADYPPGTTVNITGAGWQPGETVTLTLVESPLIDTHGPFTVVADANGRISDSSFTTDSHDVGIRFYLTAVGAQSQAQNTFTDNKSVSIAFTGTGSGTVTSTGGSGSLNCTSTGGSPSGACSNGSFGNNDTVTLTAAPLTPSTVGAWTVPSYTILAGCTAGSLTCKFTMDNSSQTITVGFNAGPANKLVFGQQPTTAQAGSSINPAITLKVTDTGGNIVNSSAAITLAIGTNPGGGILSGTTTVNAVNGVATFTGLSINKAGTGYTLTASSGALTGATSNAFNITAGGATQLVFTTQPSASTVGGVAFSTQPQVTIEDAAGNTVNSAAQVTLTITSGTGTTGAALTCTTNPLAAVAGVASFAGCKIDKAGNGYTLTATSAGLTSATSSSFSITVGAAAKLAFTTQPSTTASSGTAFGQQPVVTVQDAAGNTVTGSSAAIALAITTGTGTAGAALTCTTNPMLATAGIAGFSGCKIDKSGTGYTLTATSTGLTSVISTAINVSAGTATQLVFTTQPSSSATGGSPFGQQPVVTLQDAAGNTVTSPAASITLTITAGTGTAGAALTCTGNPVNTSNGVAAFGGCKIDKVGSGYTLTASSANVASAVSTAISVTPGVATRLVFSTSPNSSAAGIAFGSQPVVTAQDAGGNSATGSSALINLTITAGTGTAGAALTCTTNPLSASAGVSTFGGCKIDKVGTNYTLTANSNGLTSAISTAFNITAGPASKLVFTQQPSTTTAGQAITPAVVVQVQDAGGNVVATDTSNVIIAISTGGAFSGGSTTTVAASSGTATFSNLVPIAAGSSFTLTASDGTLTNATSNNFTVNPGKVTQFVFSTINSPQVAGTAFNISITAKDANNNTDTSFTGSNDKVMLSSNGTILGGSFNSGPFLNGVLTGQSVTITNTGTFTLTATATGNSGITGVSNSFTVNPGIANKLAFGQQPSNTAAGLTISPAVTVQVQDAFSNLVTTSSASVGLSIATNPSSGTLSGVTSANAVNGVATFSNLSINKGGVGYTLAAVSTGLVTATSATFNVNNPSPTLTGIAPTNGNISQTLDVIFTGTNFITGVSSVNVGGADIIVNATTVNSATQLTANVTIASNATIGTRNFSVTNSGPGGGTSATQTFTVNNPATTTVVTSSLNPSTFGASVTFTATVGSISGTPTGSVTFYDGGTCALPGTLVSGPTALVSGQAGFSTSALSAGSHTILACYAPTGVYLASFGSVTQVVNQAQATLAFDNLTFGYDGTPKPVTVTTNPANLTGVTILYNGGASAPTNAGITPLSASLTNANYTATAIMGNETIQAAPVVITITDPMPTYDANPHMATISVVPPVSVAVTYNGLGTLPTTAGTYAVVVTTMDANYAGSANGTLTIKQAQPTVTWANPADISFGTALSTTQLNATASVPGTFTYTPAAGSVLQAGAGQTLSADFAPTDAVDYAAVLGTKVQINVTAASLYVVSSDGSRALGQTNPTFTPTFLGLTDGDTSTTVGTVTCLSAAGTTSAPGTYAATCSGVSSPNYTVKYIAGTLSVSNPLNAITQITGVSPNSETLTIGQSDTLTATGTFTDASRRALSVAGGTSFAKAALPAPLSGAAMAEAGGVLYAIGGSDGTNTLKAIQAYDPKNDMWSASSAALQTARSNAAVASVAGKIYVIGGKDAGGQALNSIEVLDTTGTTPSVSAYSIPLSTARSAAGAAAFNNKLYVVGGSDSLSNALSTVEIFDLIIGGAPSTADAGSALSQASAAVFIDSTGSKLYVAGVSGSSVVVKSFDGITWSNAINNSLAGAGGVGAAALGGQLYIVNGPSMWSYDGTGFVQKNSLGNAHNGTQPVSIGSLIYAASVGSGTASSFVDAFAPDELKWTSADATKATVDQSGKITAIAITSPGAVVINAASLSDPTITAQFQLTIIKKTQTIQFAALGGKTYGDADFSISATSLDSTSTATGLLVGFAAGTGDSCTVGASTLTTGVSSATVHITGAGSCTITAAQPGDDTTWQAATSVPQTFAIAKAALTVSAADATRYYGVNNPTFTGTISGIQNGDNVTATYASAATATSPVGPYPIVPTLVDPSGKLGNYNVSSTNGTLTVKAVAITATADPQTKVYGDSDPALTYKVTAGELVAGDSFTGGVSRAIGESVGSYAITQGTLALSSNYILTFASANLTITARPIAVTADPETRVFGSPDPSPLTYKVTGTLVSGDAFSGALARAPGTDVGSYAINQGTLALSSNYVLTFVSANFTITQATPLVSATGGTFPYNGNAETGTGAAVGVSLEPLLPVTLTYFDASNTALSSAPVNAGNYTVVAVYGGSLNYKANSSAPAAIVITAIPLFIEANYKTRTANAPDPVFDATYVGLINGETSQSASLSGTLTCTSTATGNSPGRYAINCSGVTSADYNITYVPGVLVITNPITAITVNPPNPSVPVFSSQAFTATGTFADGTSRSLTSGGGAWSSVTAMPTPVSGAAVGLINGMIYVAGGSNGGAATDSTEAYDITNNTWTAKHAMIAPRSASFSSNGAVINGKFYVVGGSVSGGCSSANEVYDPASDSWSTLTAMPTPRCDLAVVAANGHLYAIGGTNNGGSTQYSTVESYDPATNAWTTKAPLPSSLTALSATVVNGKIYVMGGWSSSGYANTNEVYDPSSDSWTAKLNMPSARSGLSSGAVDGVIYAIGGQDSTGSLSTVEAYNPLSDSWTTKTAVPQAIESAGVVSANDVLYVAGGIVSGTAVASLQTYTPDDISWASGTTSVSTIDSTGNAAALVPGTSTITAASLTIPTVQGNTLLTVIQATPVFSALSSPTIVYGTASNTLSGKLTLGTHIPTGSVSITVNGVTQSAAIAAADGSFTATFATNSFGVSSSPYTITYSYAGDTLFASATDTTKTLTVTPASLTVTASSASVKYAAAVPAITASYTGFVNGETTASLSTAPTCTTLAHGSPNASPVGTYATNCAGAVDSNYIISYTSGTVTITAVPLSITASSTTANYGVAVPAITPIYNGLVNGDTAASLGTVTCTTAAHGPPSGSPVGSYASNCSGAVNSNYVISYTPGTVTITAVPLSITASSATANYGAAVPAITPSYSGLVNGDTAASLGTVTCTTAAHGPPSGSPVGSYASNCSGAVNSNYVISYTPGTVTITAVPLSITASSTTANYGAAVPAITPSYNGFVNADTAASLGTVTCTTAAHGPPSGSPVGSYATNCSGAVNNNYVVSYTPGTVTITAVPLSITASSTTANYGVAVPAITASYIGFVNGDTSSSLTTAPTCTTAAHGPPSGSPVGSYATNCSGAVNNNYVVSYTPGTVTITAVPLSITASSGAMIYGGPVFMVAPIYSGFVNGDTSASLSTAASCGTQATSLSQVGAYVSACSGAADGNYMITYLNGMVTVMPATTTTAVVSSSPNNTSTYMQLVTFTATVVPQYAGTTPTGTVTFYNNGSSIGTGTLSSSWCGTPPCADQAAFNISSLPDSGPDNITAVYGGDGNFVTSTSPAIIQTVLPAPNVSLSPMSLSFGNQNVNTTSRPAAVVLTNIGDATLNINVSGITISPNTDFAQTNNCGASVLPTKSCTISITFSPVDTGIRTAVLQITDNDDDASGAQQTVALTGSGLSTIPGTSLFTDAVFATANGCGSIVMSGGSTVDSFNSSQGYASSHTPSGGNVGTNGNVTLNGSKSAIYGSVAASSGSTGNCSKTSVTGVTTNGGAQVTGSVTAVNASISYPNPPAPNPAPPTTTQNISGSCGSVAGCSNTGSKAVSLMPGQYGNLTINGGTTAHFSHGTYNVNSLTLSGQSILLVDSGPIVINLAGASLSGGNPAMDATGGTIQNPTLTAENLQITYSGSRGLNLSGGTASYATVYAPNALVNMSGGTDFLGSIIASTVTNSGGTAIHYDSSLPAIASGNYIWFDAIANTVGGLPSNGAQVKLYLTNSSISFTANGTAYTVPVPNAVVTFNSASQTTGAKTSYDPVNSRWGTAVAKSGLTGNTFVTGVAFQLPANFPTGIQNVTWSASYSTDTPGITLQWQWGAAVYSAFSSVYATTSPMNNNVLGVNPEDGTAGSDLAGTPENYKASVIFGATGGGGTNYTGYFSAAAGVVPTVAPMSVSPSSLDFGAQTQGSTSGAMTVTLTNNDSAAHIISSITPTGANASDFAVTNTCPIKPISLGTGSSCTITVIFTPGDVGTRTAKVGVNDDANNTPQTVYLSGAGQ